MQASGWAEEGFHLLKPGSPGTTLCPCALCATQLAEALASGGCDVGAPAYSSMHS